MVVVGAVAVVAEVAAAVVVTVTGYFNVLRVKGAQALAVGLL